MGLTMADAKKLFRIATHVLAFTTGGIVVLCFAENWKAKYSETKESILKNSIPVTKQKQNNLFIMGQDSIYLGAPEADTLGYFIPASKLNF
ncbi:MAG: hypothetical protein U0X76_02065 [Bacteroidia bacterium]